MKIPRKIAAAAAVVMAGAIALTGCSDASRASENLSVAADNFEINRRIVFVNGITDKYLMSIEGRCSITADTADGQLEVTCKIAENQYKKHYLGISDNVTYFVEQLDVADVSVYHYRVIFKPEALLPSLEVQTGRQ